MGRVFPLRDPGPSPCSTVDLGPHLTGKLETVLRYQQEAAAGRLGLLLQLRGRDTARG